MADTDHTLLHHFVGSEFSDKSYKSHTIDQFVINDEAHIKSENEAAIILAQHYSYNDLF